ncbi:hypothetical protein DCS_06611 [Drechmeria coniospora]|uniref:Uncharacterized protein n=1 Tax=Drechmeria coniospora TaxID=98403 RepID=A0A151GC68_DRECN|nr:hypothetical protein DCS_06611 [Drechmeria coniospora]KYK54651.1 hypothetical protein DCS_06611 [Drechmeria coniospora]ODA76123.1 hypothetical protein RJ55_08406 [Drechmeria coniospora]
MMVQRDGAQQQQQVSASAALYPSGPGALPQTATTLSGHKRKASTQDNERLSKRLSLLNLERGGGPKLFASVEPWSAREADATTDQQRHTLPLAPAPDDLMQVDDSKHKVYIYDIDKELSADGENDAGQVVLLADIKKHLQQNCIPPQVLANRNDELADMQMVLYSDPKSLTVPEERDGVRKAVIEARRRVRERQRQERGGVASLGGIATAQVVEARDEDGDVDAMDMD